MCRTKSKVAAITRTVAYPTATNPNCIRQEIDFTRAFYRSNGQGRVMASLVGGEELNIRSRCRPGHIPMRIVSFALSVVG